LLQAQAAGVGVGLSESGQAVASLPRGLCVGATSVLGPTTVPVTGDIFSYALVVDVGSASGNESDPAAASDVALSSDLFEPGESATDLVDEVVHAFGPAAYARRSLERFGAALSRFVSDPRQRRLALLECILVPLVATTMSGDERTEALDALRPVAQEAGVTDADVNSLERRLRERLA
jgi:hypothetical protein